MCLRHLVFIYLSIVFIYSIPIYLHTLRIYMHIYLRVRVHSYESIYLLHSSIQFLCIYILYIYTWIYICVVIQPIADRVAQHPEVIFKNFQFSTRVLMGFIICYLVLIVNPMGRILVRCKSFRNNLEMLCHPISNRL